MSQAWFVPFDRGDSSNAVDAHSTAEAQVGHTWPRAWSSSIVFLLLLYLSGGDAARPVRGQSATEGTGGSFTGRALDAFAERGDVTVLDWRFEGSDA